MIRTGIGYDVHKLVKGNGLIIGGITVPSNLISLGHSDGDALIHAIIDAMLGAAGLGDIGKYFPSSNEKWKGYPSSYFLKETIEELEKFGYRINNIDSTIVLQSPLIADYISEIINNLSLIMKMSPIQISVKATTTDGLGSIGASEGWSSIAIVTLSDD